MPGNINFSMFWSIVGRSVPPLSQNGLNDNCEPHSDKNKGKLSKSLIDHSEDILQTPPFPLDTYRRRPVAPEYPKHPSDILSLHSTQVSSRHLPDT